METANPSSRLGFWLDTLLTALAPAIWGSTYLVTTQFLPPDRPFTAALLRCLPSGILLVLFCKRLPQSREWGRLLVLAALNIGFFQALLFIAAYRLPGGMAAVIGSIQPLLIMAMAWLMDRRRPAALAITASIFAVLGMAALLLSATAVMDGVGLAAAAAGAICMAGGTYLSRRWQSGLPVLAFTGWQLLLGGLILLPITVMVDAPLPTLNLTQILGYAYLSMIGALLAYSLWFRGIARLSPVAVSSLGLLSPITAVILGWVVLDQSMRGLSLAGLFIVLGSVIVVQKSMRSQA